MKESFVLLLLAICSITLSKQQQCGWNQVYMTCGPICPPVCKTTPHIVCPKICVRGCFCVDGYVLLSYGSRDCILPYQCPK